jgi:uncharacterized protein YpmB
MKKKILFVILALIIISAIYLVYVALTTKPCSPFCEGESQFIEKK